MTFTPWSWDQDILIYHGTFPRSMAHFHQQESLIHVCPIVAGMEKAQD